MEKLANHLYILLTIIFAVASQFLMRWQAINVGSMPNGIVEKFNFFIDMIFNPWILLAFVFTLLSGVMWLIAMTKFELSYAYPFISVNYVLILFLSPFFFNESISFIKILGTLLILLGTVILLNS